MKLTVCNYINTKELHLYGFSDWHLGSADCDEELIQLGHDKRAEVNAAMSG